MITLTLAETAARLRISTRTLRRLTRAGHLPIVRLSLRRLGIPLEAVEAYEQTGWQSAPLKTAAMSLNSSKAASAYFAAARRASQKRKRNNSSENCAALYSIGPLSDAVNRLK